MKQGRFLNTLSYRGLQVLGDIMAPGDAVFPSFKRLGCAEHFDSIAEHMPESDRKDLVLLLTVFGFFPKILMWGILFFIEQAVHLPDFLGGPFFRFLRLGLRGLVWSLYYSGWKGSTAQGKTPLQVLEYSVGVVPLDGH